MSDLEPGLSEALSRGFCYGNANRAGHLSQNRWGLVKGLRQKDTAGGGGRFGAGLSTPRDQWPWTLARWAGCPRGPAHLAPGDVHEHSHAGRVAALAGDVGPVPGQQLAALGRPASRPTRAAKKNGGMVPSTTGVSKAPHPRWSPCTICTSTRHPLRATVPAVTWDGVNTLPSLLWLAWAPKELLGKSMACVSPAVKLKRDISGPPHAPFVRNMSQLLKQPLCTSVFF